MVFSSVVRNGGYRAASEEMHLTRSAISQAVTSLEENLGYRLFHRVGRKLVPTEKARALNSSLRVVTEELHGCLERLGSDSTPIAGRVRIGAYLEFAKRELMAPMSEFLHHSPEVQVKWTFEAPSRLSRLLIERKIDMAFSIFPIRGIKAIHSTPLYSERLVLVAPKNWLGESPDLEEILRQPLADYFPNHLLMSRWVQHHYGRKIRKLPIRYYGATAEMVLEFVRARLAIGVVPEYLLLDLQEDFHVIRPGTNQLSDWIWLNEYKRDFANSAHQAFSKFVRDYFAEKSA